MPADPHLLDASFWAQIVAAFLLAVIVPLAFIVCNHEVRIRRIRLIEEFRRNFLQPKMDGGQPQSPPGPSRSPSFEFAATKYIVGLFGLLDEEEEIEDLRRDGATSVALYRLVGRAKIWNVPENRILLLAFLPYAAAVALLVRLFFPPMSPALGEAFRAIAGEDGPRLVVAAMLGAYFFTLRVLMRSITNFDLSAVAVLRVFGHFLETLMVVLVFGALLDRFGGAVGGAPEAGSASARFAEIGRGLMVLAAFVIGSVPDAGIQFLYNSGRELASKGRLAGLFSIIKKTDSRFTDLTRSVSLDVIDGIDFTTRYRLEWAGVYEVQNLATSNPILLHLETLFGIYQTIDWVAQAQLCTIVGLERFLLFQQYDVRTIFDLERLVQSSSSTHEVRMIVASILFHETETFGRVLRAAAAEQRIVVPLVDPTNGDAKPDFAGAVRAAVRRPATISERNPAWNPKDPAGAPRFVEVAADDATLRHFVRTIVDDLHVHRLREIWEKIAFSLGRDGAHLDDNIDADGPPITEPPSGG